MNGALLEPAFVRALEALSVNVRRRVRGTQSGERRSTRTGASVEFMEHRAYARGDDLRGVDWKAFARLGELVVRLHAAEQDAAVYVLLDTSASMQDDTGYKGESALRHAAALGYLALTAGERVTLLLAAGANPSTTRPMRGRMHVHAMLASLAAARFDGASTVDRVIDALLRRRARPGPAVIVTDLYEDARTLDAAHRLAAARFEPVILHLLSPEEIAPTMRGEHRLDDSEGAGSVLITVDDEAIALYRARLEAFCTNAERFCARRGVRYVRASTADDPVDTLARVLA